MTVPTKIKQPGETKDYDFVFTNAMPTADTVASATVTATPTGLTLGAQAISGQTVKRWMSGGTDSVTYKITCVATTTQGRILELEMNLKVQDV